MTATGKAVQYPRTFGLPWVPSGPRETAHVGLSGTLRLDRDPVEVVAGAFLVQRGGASATVCQVDWRVEGITADPVLPAHFVGGVLPSGQAFFAAGVVEVPVSLLLSPGADPARESYGRVLLDNPINCELAAGRGELPLSIVAEPIDPGDAIVSLNVSFSIIDPEEDGPPPPPPPTGDYAYDFDLLGHRVLPNTSGADLWPSTWAANGNTYTVFGDGPSVGEVSLGLARLTGSTLAGLAVDWLVGGPSPSVKARFDPVAGWPTAPDGGLHAKCTSLIALGTNLYLWLAKGGSNPNGWSDTRIARIALGSIAAGPTLSSWAIGSDQPWIAINPAWLQCGQDFATAWDEYVYAFPQHYAPVDNLPGDSPSHNPARFYLLRCLRTANLQTQANWQWWTGGTDDAPTWGSYADRQARITMTGQIDWRPSAFHIGGTVDLCLFRIGRTGDPAYGGGSMSRFATFIARRPWQAWTMIADQQYTAPGLDPDLAQVAPIPSTLAIDGGGVATWIDTTWGGDNTDRCIVAPSTLTPVP